MPIDTRSLTTKILIGGRDLSLQLSAVLLSDDYLDERGLVTVKGTIDLSRTIGGLSLNDFFGIDWLRIGTEVKVSIALGGNFYPHPRGTLYILGTKYEPKTGSNQIEVVCRLGFSQNNEALDELLIAPTIGNARAAIARLLDLAGCGVPIWHTAKNFNLCDRPVLKNSYIASAGELAAAMGCYCYADQDGVIHIRDVEDNPTIFTIPEADLVTFEGVLVGSPVSPKAFCSGTYRECRERPLASSVVLPIYGDVGAIVPGAYGRGLISRTTIIEYVNFAGFTVQVREISDRIAFQVYKGRTGFPRTGLVRESFKTNIKYYNPGGEHELIAERELNSSVAATALQSFGEWASSNKKPFNASTDVPGKRIVDYIYSDKLELITVTESIFVAIGETLASLSAVDWKVVYDAFGLPDEEFLSERNTQTWSKASGDWQRVTVQEFANLKLANGQAGITEKISKAKPSELLGIYRDAVSCSAAAVKHESSNSGQVTPPDIERFPSRIITTQKSVETIVNFSGFSGNNQKSKTYTAPYLPDVAPGESVEAFLYAYGAVWHKAALIRWQSIQIQLPFSLGLLNAYPYAQIDVTGPTGVYRLALNGTSWAVAPTQALVSSDCSLVGVVQAGGVLSRYAGNNIIKFGLFFITQITSPVYDFGSSIKLAIQFQVGARDGKLITGGLVLNFGAIDLNSVSNLQFGFNLEFTSP